MTASLLLFSKLDNVLFLHSIKNNCTYILVTLYTPAKMHSETQFCLKAGIYSTCLSCQHGSRKIVGEFFILIRNIFQIRF